jgi:hypothetical protein
LPLLDLGITQCHSRRGHYGAHSAGIHLDSIDTTYVELEHELLLKILVMDPMSHIQLPGIHLPPSSCFPLHYDTLGRPKSSASYPLVCRLASTAFSTVIIVASADEVHLPYYIPTPTPGSEKRGISVLTRRLNVWRSIRRMMTPG